MQNVFARMLQVEVAYHSRFMAEIGSHYKKLLLDASIPGTYTIDNRVHMYSSLLGHCLNEEECDADYWRSNMVSPVLFQDAMKGMIGNGVTMTIEIGPSGALAGPIAQIKKELGSRVGSFDYCTALQRKQDSRNTLLDAAGRAFISGYPINMAEVNRAVCEIQKPLVIVDLPNYSWNHSVKYWHESESSADWRFRPFISHDLLGSKVMGTPWTSPAWRKVLRLEDVPWLRDHRIGNDIVFPAAGYLSVAIEAMYQTGRSNGSIGSDKLVNCVSYRTVRFLRALDLEEGVPRKILLCFAPGDGVFRAWYEFRVSSWRDAVWTEHCRGMIRIDLSLQPPRKTATSLL